MIPLSTAVIKEEIDLAMRILTKWQNKINEGIPGVDIPAHEDQIEAWCREFGWEIHLVSKKLDNLAEVVINSDV